MVSIRERAGLCRSPRDPARASGLRAGKRRPCLGGQLFEVGHDGEQVEWCRFENVPAYVAAREIRLELPGYGQVSADLAWGGNYFGTVDCRGTGITIRPENGSELSRLGVIVREMLREKVKVQHPSRPHINFNFVTLWQEPTLPGAFYKCV